MKKCPFCGEEIQEDALKCRYCREWFNNGKSNVDLSQEKIMKDEPTDDIEVKNGLIKSDEVIMPEEFATEKSEYEENLKEHFGSMTVNQLLVFKKSYNESEYTPEARKTIEEVFSLRKEELEMEEISSNKESSNFEYGKIDSSHKFKIDDSEIEVAHTDKHFIYVQKDGEKVFVSEKKQKTPIAINILGHEILINFKSGSGVIQGLLNWNTGLSISLDGKPIEGTAQDPNLKIKNGSYGILFFSGLAFLTVVLISELSSRVLFFTVFIILLTLGLLTKKAPKICLSLGLLIGLIEFIFHLIGSIEMQSYEKSMGFFLFWIILRAGAILAIAQGFRASFNMKK